MVEAPLYTPDLPEMGRLRALITDDPLSWEKAWKEEQTPWEYGSIEPPLRDVILSGEINFARTGRALVPGCGKGNDAIFIASSLGLDTLAVDISSTAVDVATKNLESLQPPPAGKVTFKQTDFFTFKVPDEERFDVVYDYLFFVAIPPSRRNDWGSQMRALVKPGGYLITLPYPIDPKHDLGPPFYVRPEHYLEPLGEGWEKVLDKVPEVSSKTHVGRERLVVWKRK